ncbi:Zn(2)-C6 fungal-type domain-containing protein [Mycena indigotica]|uniref:Zn(2)-C6 fungal-type domain-containing protein n=1 Tax=Mycena indigotica TaxID=2126181 RepID=A0A8H6SHW5_9AGAR|nr:Zn(2)-C6 fungal-type domain-containing protein [Mycena indigotica]KAF7298647.1 Zn(2)-C6 fungal-type domain-containing protein [Mycena indigotica]
MLPSPSPDDSPTTTTIFLPTPLDVFRQTNSQITKTKTEDMDMEFALDTDHRKRRRNRTTQSCLNCHTSKRKCDRKRPCQRCIQLGLTGLCVYEIDDPALRDDPSIDESTRLRNRIAELESLVRELRGMSFRLIVSCATSQLAAHIARSRLTTSLHYYTYLPSCVPYPPLHHSLPPPGKPHPRWADAALRDGDPAEKWHSRASKHCPPPAKRRLSSPGLSSASAHLSSSSAHPPAATIHPQRTLLPPIKTEDTGAGGGLYRFSASPPPASAPPRFFGVGAGAGGDHDALDEYCACRGGPAVAGLAGALDGAMAAHSHNRCVVYRRMAELARVLGPDTYDLPPVSALDDGGAPGTASSAGSHPTPGTGSNTLLSPLSPAASFAGAGPLAGPGSPHSSASASASVSGGGSPAFHTHGPPGAGNGNGNGGNGGGGGSPAGSPGEWSGYGGYFPQDMGGYAMMPVGVGMGLGLMMNGHNGHAHQMHGQHAGGQHHQHSQHGHHGGHGAHHGAHGHGMPVYGHGTHVIG